jgi:integrase
MFLLLFLYQTAARVQEVLDVRLCDIVIGETSIVTLRGKGAKTRTVPLREKFVQHLKRYLAIFHPDSGRYSDNRLFYIVRDGMPKRMTEDNVRRIVRQYGTSARRVCPQVPENLHPHMFRHSRGYAFISARRKS